MVNLSTTALITIPILLLFFGIMIAVGFYCRKHSTSVDGFVLGGRAVGPWLTAFAFGTSYFSAVIFIGYAGQLVGILVLHRLGLVWAMLLSVHCLRGLYLVLGHV